MTADALQLAAAPLVAEALDAARDAALDALNGTTLIVLRRAGLTVVDADEYERLRSDARRWREHVDSCRAAYETQSDTAERCEEEV